MKIMMYSSWDTERERQNFLSFWAIFCPFTALTTWKIKILKKWRYHFTQVCHKWQSHDWYMVPDLWSMTERISCHFGPFFALLFTPLTTRKNKILKKWKNTRRDHHFRHRHHMMYGFWDMVRDKRRDGQAGGKQMTKVTFRGGCPT